ncbi:AraC family transcriptional regulator [Teredinibacter sp. KSP-S5-2]|uniref:AraC family transcriptional regulator n=1 Tax=Teredinibacter sp. KSP-S5-2 TaxID=3034506 RepID=UPI002934B044|nr:AraC family transcriptional regulator [Teredinibacter sp. KSP-S5-2]WNO09945.1 AraC family transcriptional regulator [Teredinibacter sp. KSP-S5-2]
MTREHMDIPSFSDPLGEALHQLRLTGCLYCRSDLTAPWGVEFPEFEHCMMFHIVTAGSCLLEIPGESTHQLRSGSMALVPHGKGHKILSPDCENATPLFDIPATKMSDRYEIMQFGGDGELTQLTCGVVRFDHVTGQKLVSLLPNSLFLDSWQEGQNEWLHSTLRFIANEAKALRPGGETILTHLADILVIQALRTWLDQTNHHQKGWLAALKDKQLGKAIAAIHRAPEQNWSVALLAQQAGMSRSGFSARFSDMVGQSPAQYLTHWRMQLAYNELASGQTPLARLAEKHGYQSEAAFSRAFKRIFAVSPGSVKPI